MCDDNSEICMILPGALALDGLINQLYSAEGLRCN